MSDNKNHAHHPLFVAIYEDGTKFIGGDSYLQTKWLELPLKKIKTLFYNLPTGDYLTLSGYDSYYHLVEATKDLNGKNKLKQILRYDYIMVKKEDKIKVYRIFLYSSKYETIELKFTNNKRKEYNSNKLIYIERRYFKPETQKIHIKKTNIKAKQIKVGDKLFICEDLENKTNEYIVKEKNNIVQKGKYQKGDITVRIFNINDKFIKSLNQMNWR